MRPFRSGLAAVCAAMATACLGDPTPPRQFRIADATLESRPGTPAAQGPAAGFTSLGIGAQRDGFIYVPSTYDHSVPVPLVVLLHGAGETSLQWQSDEMRGLAEEFGFVLMAPDARARSWDFLIEGHFGSDVVFLDLALDRVFDLCNIDPTRVVLAGFSDGASYALSLGLINGDLFNHIIGFSPALLFAPERRGTPDVFISHGANDPVISVTNSRDNLVPALRGAGYMVEFVEFDGGHAVPLSVARSAFTWIGAAP